MTKKILPECQFDPLDERDSSQEHYSKALIVHRGSSYVKRNMDHLEMALQIRRIARIIEDTKKLTSISPYVALGGIDKRIAKVYMDGTWEGYRVYIRCKYNVDMGPVPEGAEIPTLAKIEATIQNWLNGEPLLFY